MQTPNVALDLVRNFTTKYDEDYLTALGSAREEALNAKPAQAPAR